MSNAETLDTSYDEILEMTAKQYDVPLAVLHDLVNAKPFPTRRIEQVAVLLLNTLMDYIGCEGYVHMNEECAAMLQRISDKPPPEYDFNLDIDTNDVGVLYRLHQELGLAPASTERETTHQCDYHFGLAPPPQLDPLGGRND